MSPNLPANRRSANPRNANVVARAVPVLGALVPSRSNPDEEHLVTWSPAGGRASCTCEGWRAKGRCYHITVVIDQVMTVNNCPACGGGDLSRLVDGDKSVVCCNRCEWAIVN